MIDESQGVLDSHTVLVSLKLVVVLLQHQLVDLKEGASFEIKQVYMIAFVNKAIHKPFKA